MAQRVEVECGCGRRFTTAVRGRGTHCPACARSVYVRTNGTARPPAQPDWPAFPDDASEEQMTAREMWELVHDTEQGPALTVREVAEEYGVSVAQVRRSIAAEQKRQGEASTAAAAARTARNPRARQRA